jgi:hypothetical protein
MRYNNNSGYGRVVFDNFIPKAPHGKVVIVGAATLDNISIVQEIYGRGDPDGILRWYSTLKASLAACFQNVAISVTCDATANVFTSTTAHGLNNGDKVYLGGTAAPGGTTAGVVYYVIGATTTTFQISAIRGGSAVDESTAGTSVKAFPIASLGDTIYVLPGHNENVSSATALDINVAGITIVGLGSDETRPTFVLDTATTAIVTISAPGVTLQNVIIDATGYAAIAAAMTVTASDVLVQNCKFNLANATNQAGLGIITTALANRLKIDSCYFYGTTDAGTTNVLQLVGGNDITISNNRFVGAYTTSLGAINNITTACLRMQIIGNYINNQTASSTKCIVLVAGSSGTIAGNFMQILSGSAPITGAGMSWVGGNYYAATIATTGTLI